MKKVCNFGIIVIISMVFVFMTSLEGVAATTVPVLDGQVSITDSVGNGSGDATKYTATVTSKFSSEVSSTIIITNETDANGKISFMYDVSNSSAFTIDGESKDTSGSFSLMLDAKGTVNIVLTAKKGYKKATLTLTDITFEPSTASNITVEFDSSLGKVTAGGVGVANGDVISVEASGIELVAKAETDAQFIAWIDENGKFKSLDSTYKYFSDGTGTIIALFAEKNKPYFLAGNTLDDSKIGGDTYVYSNWDEAFTNDYVCLMCDGVLQEGEYIIPDEKTLLIPFDDAYTLCTAIPLYEDVGFKKPTSYRTLTLANGANIVVNGAISLGGKQSSIMGAHGSPIGTYGHISMKDGSKITVNSGANLYAWGYITGAGSVIAKSGSTVYENFQLRDYRGGNATSGMVDNSERVFPMSQYYVQNIEVPLTLEAGAAENGYMYVYVGGYKLGSIQVVDPFTSGTEIRFIGENGMFNITSGYIIKDYDENKDRLDINVNGTMEMASLSITMKITALGESTIDSSKYTLPINGNITLNVNEGSVVNVSQDIALLPGGEINVYKGAKCTFSSNAKAYIYDFDEWGGYCSQNNLKLMPVNFAPGGNYTREEKDLVDAKVYIEGEVDASNGFVYTTETGADVQGAEGGLVKINLGTDTVTYQVTQNNTNIEAYNEIPVTTAWLKNADGTYTNPEDFVNCSSYTYSNGKWNLHNYSTEWTIDTEPTCTTAGSKSHHCLNCDEKADITVIDALEHDTTTHEAQAPTCEAIGWDAYETCSRCDYTTYAEKPALGHGYGEKWIEADATYHKKVCANDENHVTKEKHTFDNFVCTACGYEKIATNTTYSIADEEITISTELNFDVSDDAQIMIATYNSDGTLLNIAIKTPSTLDAVTFSSKDVVKIKVFVWDGFDTMKPVSLPEQVPVTDNNN